MSKPPFPSDRWQKVPVGSGITAGEAWRITLDPSRPDELQAALDAMGHPWISTREEILQWLTDNQIERLSVGDWKERSDYEWYVVEIWKLLSVIESLHEKGHSSVTTGYGVQLGILLHEAEIKFKHEHAVLKYNNIVTSARDAAQKQRGRSAAERIADMEMLVKQGVKVTKALAIVAANEGCSVEAIRSDWYKRNRF